MSSAPPANLLVLLGLGIAGILLMVRKKKPAIKIDFGAFIKRLQLLPPPQPPPPKARHPLTGLTFAVSDVFDIEGHVTGFGNPDWESTHEPATQTSNVVSALVDGGATCIGKTVVDDMALSISGENKHYGTPTNPAVTERIPGGASSGASVAVAAGLADFSLGIDTDGGVRVPAGFCGVLGFRPSHGIVSLSGVIPVSTSLDTVGWFAKDASVLRRVGHVVLPFTAQRTPRNFVIADDFFRLSTFPAVHLTNVVVKSIEGLYGRQTLRRENLGDYLALNVPSLKKFDENESSGAETGDAEEMKFNIYLLANTMQKLKRYEFSQNHGEWIESKKPKLDPASSRQVVVTTSLVPDPEAEIYEAANPEIKICQAADSEVELCQAIRSELRSAINGLLKDDGILIIPTCTNPPSKLGAKENSSEKYLIWTSALSSLASMSGCCQVAIPLGVHEKCPVSLSILARHGGDRFLLDTLQDLYCQLRDEFEAVAKSKPTTNDIPRENSAEMAKSLGNQAFQARQWPRAIACYTEAIKLDNSNATYYNNRAAAYLEMGSYLQVEADCTDAIARDNKSVKAYFRRGTAREMLGFYKEAMADFNHALVLQPNNKRASEAVKRISEYIL